MAQQKQGDCGTTVVMRCLCCQCEIPEAAIMSAAARIAVSRRKSHKGAAPKTYACRWCRAAIAGRSALEEHERSCTQARRDWEPLQPADLQAVSLEGFEFTD